MHTIFNHLEKLTAPRHSIVNELPYIFCNEQKQGDTLQQLVSLRRESQRRLHVGFSVWFNFDIIYAEVYK